MQVSSTGLRPIGTYADALQHYNDTVPYRSGQYKGERPLGSNRRYKYLRMEKGEANEIYFKLVDSNVVTFFEDGRIAVSLCKWDTVSTRQFIDASTSFSAKHERGQTYLKVSGKWYAFADSNTPIIIKADGTVDNPVQEYVYRINRKAMAAKRQEYGEFVEYVKSMGNVLVGIKDTEIPPVAERLTQFSEKNMYPSIHRASLLRLNLPNPRGYARLNNETLVRLEKYLDTVKTAQVDNDLQTYYDLFVLLGVSSLNYNSYLNSFVVHAYRDNAQVEIGKVLLNFFDEIIKYIHKEEVFNKVEVPIGTSVSNDNRKYFL